MSERDRLAFEARYHGRCGACDEQITPGDSVYYDFDDTLVHWDCDDAAPPLERPRDVCSTCWLIRPCACDDEPVEP